MSAFKGLDQITFFVIEGQVGQIVLLVEGYEAECFVPAYFDIGVIGKMVMRIELFHFVEWLIGGHDDLDILEFIKIGQ